jgi:hypothetical protein
MGCGATELHGQRWGWRGGEKIGRGVDNEEEGIKRKGELLICDIKRFKCVTSPTYVTH